MYCGIGPVPKNKVRGTPEYCVETNQVRYYGLELIDKKLLNKDKSKATGLIKEQLKLKKIQDDAKILIKEVQTLKMILETEGIKPSKKKTAEKQMDALRGKRDRLVKRLKSQQAIVENLEKEEARQEKDAARKEKEKRRKEKERRERKQAGSKTAKKTKK